MKDKQDISMLLIKALSDRLALHDLSKEEAEKIREVRAGLIAETLQVVGHVQD